MVKVWGQNLNRKMFKQTAKNGQKISCDDDAAGIASLLPGVKNLRLRNCLEFDQAYSVFPTEGFLRPGTQVHQFGRKLKALDAFFV